MVRRTHMRVIDDGASPPLVCVPDAGAAEDIRMAQEEGTEEVGAHARTSSRDRPERMKLHSFFRFPS